MATLQWACIDARLVAGECAMCNVQCVLPEGAPPVGGRNSAGAPRKLAYSPRFPKIPDVWACFGLWKM